MAEVLTDAYMSSQESDQEDERLVYVVKTVPWERREKEKWTGFTQRNQKVYLFTTDYLYHEFKC